MIHDATVEVTCDREGCIENEIITLEWAYRNRNEMSGYYDCDEGKIENTVTEYHEWTVRDGKHFCSSECAEAAGGKP